MSAVPLVAIVLYLVATTALGSLLARRSTTAAQWAVAGSGMGGVMVAAGLAGTRIGGAATYGVAGNVVSGGVWYLWWFAVSTFLALAVVGLFFAVPYRRLQLQTVGEAFRKRFGSRRSQALSSFCVQTEYLVVNVIEAYVIGVIVSAVAGWSLAAGVAVAAVVLVSYTTLGGLWGAAVTNLVHCAVMLVGLVAISWLGLSALGGWEAVAARVDAHLASAGRDAARFWSPAGACWAPSAGMVFAAAIHTPAASIYANFSTAARREGALLPAFLAAGAVAAVVPLLGGFVGVLTLARYGFDPGLSGYQNVTRLALELSPLAGGLALAAILAAVISSGGPVLLSSATMLVRDWLPFSERLDSRGRLRAYRITTAVYGVLAAVVAWAVARLGISVLDLLLFAYAMVVPPAVAVGFVLYWRRTTEAGVFWGMAAGYAAGAVHSARGAWSGQGFDPSSAPTLVPLLVVPLVSLAGRPDPEGAEAFYGALATPAAPAPGEAA